MRNSKFFLRKAVFLFWGLLFLYPAMAQNEVRKDILLDKVKVTELVKKLGVVYPYSFFITDKEVSETIVSVDVKNATVEQALTQAFAGKNLSFSKKGKNIIISSKQQQPVTLQPPNAIQQPVSGVITDDTGSPVIGANVIEKGTNNGMATDVNGVFSLNVGNNAVLQITYLGYITEEVQVANHTQIHVTLYEDTRMMDEVVIVGYGTMRKSDLTGSVVSVNTEKITAFPTQGVVQALQGCAPGLQITNLNGAPGASIRIRIRGGTSLNANNDPLWVVDGFACGMAPPPEDIESIELLKDASATAIYGSRGANGVVLVTTKSGKSGRIKVNLNASYSVDNISKTIAVLDARQYGQLINEIDTRAGIERPRFADYASYGKGTDWQSLVYRTGNKQNHHLSISGGTDQIKSYTSLKFYDNDGIIIHSNYKYFSALSNIDYLINKRLKFGINLNYMRTMMDGVKSQEESGGPGDIGVPSGAMTFEPTTPVYEDDGVTYTISRVGDPTDNPYAVAMEYVNQRTNDNFQGGLYGELRILEDLSFRSTLSVTTYNNRQGAYHPTTLVKGRAAPSGDAYISAEKNTNIQTEHYFTYKKTVGGHHFTAMTGYSWQKNRSENWAMTNRTFPTDQFLWWSMGAGSLRQSNASSLNEWVMVGFYSRFFYNYSDRYLATFTGRYDGSSRLGRNSKWGFFPSAALAWNIHNEEFLKSNDLISQLKLRTSYGTSGNTDIGTYRSLANLQTQLVSINEVQMNGIRPDPDNVPYDDLRWEKTIQTNIGLDIGLFRNRLNINADYYLKKTEGLLYDFPLPQYSGYSTATSNIGSIGHKGFELLLNTVNIQNPDFAWATDFNISFDRGKVLSLPLGEVKTNRKPGHITDFTETHILTEGKPVGSFYGYIYDGVDRETGMPVFRDIGSRDANGNWVPIPDGQVTMNDDRTIIGNPNPNFIFGFNNTFNYKNFDLNLFFQGVAGNDMYNFMRMELEWVNGKTNQMTTVLNRWTESNRDTDIPVANNAHSAYSSSRWIEKGSYLKLRNVALGYNFKTPITQRIGIEKWRIYVSGQDLLTFTGYTGFDPDVSYNNDNQTEGCDYGSYPRSRSVTFGLNLIF